MRLLGAGTDSRAACWCWRRAATWSLSTRRCSARGELNACVAALGTHNSVSFRRLQHHILLGQPTRDDVEAIVRLNMRKLSCSVEPGLDAAVMTTILMMKRPSCADAEALCQRALALAIREEIETAEKDSNLETDSRDSGRLRMVSRRHFALSLSELTGVAADRVDALWDQRAAPFAWTGQFSG